MKPTFKVFADEVRCEECQEKEMMTRNDGFEGSPSMDEILIEFSLDMSSDFLNLKLEEIGIPKLHILQIRDEHGEYRYIELTGDEQSVMPNIYGKKAREEGDQ